MSKPIPPGAMRPCIGVFDSGFGGLTVLHALIEQIPGADFVYLGDTARLPYGSKSAQTVTRYTAAAIQTLEARGADLVVIACNTASALALPSLQAAVPLVGVIKPGAASLAAAVPAQRKLASVLVLATEATVASHAYAHACASLGLTAFEKACPLLVPLVEEGWTDHEVTRRVAEIYLREALQEMRQIYGEECFPSAILLGCTHYPLLRLLLEEVAASVMSPVPFVDSATATAAYVHALLPSECSGTMRLTFLATDSTDKFGRLGSRFLGYPITAVERIDLDGQS